MASQRVEKNRRRIVIILLLLLLGLFLFFGETSPLPEILETHPLDWLEEFLDFHPKKEVLTTDLEHPLASVHFIDVGQGEAILLRTPEGDLLIDGGEPQYGSDVVDYLEAAGVTRLELIVATHPHSDHIGGLATVMDHFPVGQLLLPEMGEDLLPITQNFVNMLETADQNEVSLISASAGSRYTFGEDVVYSIVYVMEDSPDLNNLSIVSRLDVGDVSFLFTGDLEKIGEDALLEAGRFCRADVLNVGHHGSNTSTSPKFLLEVDPQLVVISCGMDNSYHHPHVEVMERLIQSEIDIYRTDLDGTVVLETDGSQLAVATQNEEGDLLVA